MVDVSRKPGDSESVSSAVDNLLPDFLQLGRDVLMTFPSIHTLSLVLRLLHDYNLTILVDIRTIQPWIGVVMR